MENNSTMESETANNAATNSDLKIEDEASVKSEQTPDSNKSIVSPDLRTKVLQVNVNLQGTSIRLDQFVSEQWVNDNCDSAIVQMLTEGDTISIGNESAFSSDGYVEDYYMSRQLPYIYPPSDIKDEKYFIEPFFKENLGRVEDVVVVTGDYGTGKSTVLTSLARQLRDLYHKQTVKSFGLWILRVDLSEHYKKLQTINFGRYEADKDKRDRAIDFLSEIEIPGDPEDSANVRFQRILLKESLCGNTKLKIVIFFDGFDDIGKFLFDHDQKRAVIRFLRVLDATSVYQMYIAAKIQDQDRLSCKLYSSRFYSLRPLGEDQQIAFLDRYWKWYLKFDEAQNRPRTYDEILGKLGDIKVENEELTTNSLKILTEYAQHKTEKFDELVRDIDGLDFNGIASKLLHDFRKIFGDGNEDFTIISLHLKMLTMSIFKENFQIPTTEKLFSLFDAFVKFKIEQFVKQIPNTNSKHNSDEGTNSSHSDRCLFYERLHAQISAKLLLGERFQFNRESMFDSKQTIAEDGKSIEKDLLEIGLLSLNGGRLHFIHRSFAEYFLSRYSVDNWQERQVQQSLVEKVFREDIFKLTRQFINDQLKNDKSLSEQLTSSMNEILANHMAKNNLASTTFDQICKEGLSEIFAYLFNNIRTDILKEFGITITYEAIRNNNIAIFEQLLSKSLEISPEILKRHILKSPPSTWQEDYLLSRIVLENNQKMIQILLNFVYEHRDKLGEGFLEEVFMPEDDESILHKSISRDKSAETVKFILNWKHLKESTVKNLILSRAASRICFVFQSQTAFHKALHLGRRQVVIEMFQVIEKYPDLMRELALKSDYFGATPLTHLIKHRNNVFDSEIKRKIVNALLKAILNDKNPNDQAVLEELIEIIMISAWTTPFESSVKQFPSYFIRELLELLDDDLNFLKEPINTIKANLSTVGEQSKRLHKAICNQKHEKVRDILKDAHDRNFIRQLMLSVPSNAFGAPLHNAVVENGIEIFKLILENIKVLSPRILTEIVVKVDKKGKGTVLGVAAESNYHEIVREFLHFVKNQLPHDVFEHLLLKYRDMYPYNLIIGSAYSQCFPKISYLIDIFKISLLDGI